MPLVQSIRPDDVPIIDIALTSPTLSGTSLRALAVDIADTLKLVPGISDAEVRGGRTNQLMVKLDADALTARNMTVSDIVQTIRRSSGSLSVSELEATLRILYQHCRKYPNADNLSHIVLREEDGSMLRLGDIADVSFGPDDIPDDIRISEKEKIPRESFTFPFRSSREQMPQPYPPK